MSLNVARVRCLAIGRVVDGDVGASTYQPTSLPLGEKDLQRDVTTLSLANDQSFPCFSTFSNNISGISTNL